MSKIDDEDYTYTSSQQIVQGCGFDFVEALYIENLATEGGFNNFSDGTFSHNMEWLTIEAINFINEDSVSDYGCLIFILFHFFCPCLFLILFPSRLSLINKIQG